MASQNPLGIVTAIAFSTSRGSQVADDVCTGRVLVIAPRTFGITTGIATLWIYCENDRHFIPELAHNIFDALHSACCASCRNHMVP